MTSVTTPSVRTADVAVVGAGPGGSAAAAYLARCGLDVVLLEKTGFPREKVCGDGLTPRAVKQLLRLGVDLDGAGWVRNRGLRVLGGGVRLELPWPELAEYPGFGLVRTRTDLDQILAGHAVKAGAHLYERTAVTAPLRDDRTGRVVGVRASRLDEPDGELLQVRAAVVLAADGVSSPFARSLGRLPRGDRPMGVAVRTYFTSPRHDDEWLESWLELWAGQPQASALLPGYGWVFGVGDGTCNVGIGLLNTSAEFGRVDYRALLRHWLDTTPPEWGFDEEHRTGRVRGAALPMGFNRTPHYRDGVLLVGDAGGLVNPFNGEGIAYALESAELAADVVVQALSRPEGPMRERALSAYPVALRQAYGGYYTLGRVFVRLLGHPEVIRMLTRHGLPRPGLMRRALKLMANLTDPRDGDVTDRVINALSRLTPAA